MDLSFIMYSFLSFHILEEKKIRKIERKKRKDARKNDCCFTKFLILFHYQFLLRFIRQTQTHKVLCYLFFYSAPCIYWVIVIFFGIFLYYVYIFHCLFIFLILSIHKAYQVFFNNNKHDNMFINFNVFWSLIDVKKIKLKNF